MSVVGIAGDRSVMRCGRPPRRGRQLRTLPRDWSV